MHKLFISSLAGEMRSPKPEGRTAQGDGRGEVSSRQSVFQDETGLRILSQDLDQIRHDLPQRFR